MRTLLKISLVCLLFGCNHHPQNSQLPKFYPGDQVKILINNKPAIILDSYGTPGYTSHHYAIRYSNDFGELKYETVKETELQKYEN